MSRPLNTLILIFDDVEVLDFCGPFEVFSVANRDSEPPAFNVLTVAESETIVARGGLKVHRNCSLSDCPNADVLLVPGGVGVQKLLDKPAIVDWIVSQAATARLVTSVCTGAVILGRCGLLDGLEATTHHRCMDQLREISPQILVRPQRRFIDTGRVITSAGISAGIDMSLHVVRRLLGNQQAQEVARRMEYDWRSESDGEE